MSKLTLISLFAIIMITKCHLLSESDTISQYSDLNGLPYSVSYNNRSIILNNKSILLLSGSVHYTRSTPEMWPVIFAKMKKAGLNAVESYVFWNFHVKNLGDRENPDYSVRANVTLFL